MSRRNVELLLLIVAAPLVILLFAMMVANGAGTEDGLSAISFNTLGVPIGIFAAFLAAHVAIRFMAPNADPAILPITFALSGIGIAFVTRLAPASASRQLIWMFLGVAILIIILLAVKHLDRLADYKYTLMLIGVLLLLSPILPGIGTEINGSRLWLKVGDFSFQPGELAKICIVLFLGAYLAQNREMLSVFTWHVGPFRLPSLQTLLPLLVMWAVAFCIVVFEKDLGSALVFFLVFLVMLYVATGKKFYVIVGVLLASIAAVALYQMFGHVQQRVEIWLVPWADAQGTGYQLVQGFYSLADGDLIGVGIGRGLCDFIPYVESDFIFDAIGEETGLLGAAGVLLLYLIFAIRGILIAARAKSDFSSFVSVGLTSIIILQAFIIVGGVTRLIPLTGITLPFISQGGSSLLAGFIIVAFLLRSSNEATGRATELQMTGSFAPVGNAANATADDFDALNAHGTYGAHGSHGKTVTHGKDGAHGNSSNPGATGFLGNLGRGGLSSVAGLTSTTSAESVLGRVSLGKRLNNTMIVYSVLFALLVANLTYIMVIDAGNIQTMPGNNHSIIRESNSERGTIATSDGVVLAQSVEQPDGTYKREYPAGTLAAHVVGYYSTRFGSAGIESTMSEALKGNQNFASWTDVINSMAGVSKPGNDVTLTINSEVQKAAEAAIDGYRGACVVIDPMTGAILAMASSPTYNAADAESILENTASDTNASSELLNRATQALYAPGSTFKTVTLTAALADGVATADSMYDAPAEMDIGNAPVSNFGDKGYGEISVRKAFELSANTVFGQLGVELGPSRLVGGADAFGFDKTFDFELPLAKSLMPDPSEMTTWETAWAADGVPVGEHESPAGPQSTVLQMAMVGCGIANKGVVMEPYIVDGIYNANGSRSYSAASSQLYQATSSQVADEVLDIMRGVVSRGTATDAQIAGVTVAGKTGTAEHGGRPDDSWFVGIADADGARNVVIAIALEEVGSTAHASGKARAVIQAALSAQGVL